MKRLRTKSAVRVAEFVSRFPLKSFLLQAPQVTADLWGVGIQLGSIMGFVADAMYGALRAVGGAKVTFRGPPPSDAGRIAASYLVQPAYHHGGGSMWSYEDHWLLLAADVIALRILMAERWADRPGERAGDILSSPVIHHGPWKQSTIEVLREQGWRGGDDYRPPFAGMSEESTYGDVMSRLVDDYPSYLEQIRVDFPASSSATIYANILAEITEELLTWGTGVTSIGKDVFDVEEYTLARMFEFGVLPPDDISVDLIDWMIQRSIEIARAGGRDLPDRGSMILAANEVWGGYSGQ